MLLTDAGLLKDVPCVLVNGRFDFQAPLANAWMLKQAMLHAQLAVVDDASHSANESLIREVRRATNRFI